MKVSKHISNPIIKICDVIPSRKDFEVIGVFNAGVIKFEEKTLLLVRVAERPIQENASIVTFPLFNEKTGEVEIKAVSKDDKKYDLSDSRIVRSTHGQNYLTSISHIRKAVSVDGVNFDVEEKPLIKAFDRYTSFGVEDARITKVGESYYVNFSAASTVGIITRLFSTEDFVSFNDLGNIYHPDNKDVTIFPEKIGELYYSLHRPSTSEYGKPNLWIASSPDLIHWGNHKLVAEVREDKWDNGRIGASCIPFLTEKGWIELYHGATKENRYCLGALLLDKDEPWKVLARCEAPLIEPTEMYETTGFFGNVVFSCGHIKDGDNLYIYYGASDDSVCLAQTTITEVFRLLNV